MSFTTEVISELMEAEQGKTCCRKAFLFGVFFGASVEKNNVIRADFRSEDVALKAAEILKRQFSATPEIFKFCRAGRAMWGVRALSKAMAAFLQRIDRESGSEELSDIVGFRCDTCARSFLSGAFIALGTVNDPKKGYHLELSVSGKERAKRLCAFLSSSLFEPKQVERGAKIGLYYKKNIQISDMLYYLGATRCGFDFSNICIERDIRNDENRATNCVTTNISKAVAASFKQMEAIELLESAGKMTNLGEDLSYTASLRMENPSMSLAELARLHEPPISKSGLNRRLARIMEEAESLKKEI